VMGLIGATAAGRLLPSIGAKPLLVVGFGLSITSFVLMALLHADSAYWPQILAAVVLAVGGNSISYVASSVIALADARPDEESLVGGLFNTGMQVGGGFGLAVMSAVAATRIGADTAGSSLLPAYRSAFWTAAAFLTVGLAIAIRFVRTPSRAGEPG